MASMTAVSPASLSISIASRQNADRRLNVSPFSARVSARFSRVSLRVRAESSGDAEPAVETPSAATSPAAATTGSADEAAAPPKKKIIRRVKPAGAASAADDLLSAGRAVEQRGISMEGVAKVDRGEGQSLLRVLATVGGDALVLIVFAYIGRATHVSAAVDWELIKTAQPFLAGWLISALLFGDYSTATAAPSSPGDAAKSAAKTWALGVPLGIAFRSLIKGQPPQVPFLAVSLVMTAIFMLGWRAALATAMPGDAEAKKAQLNKSGNVFELMELLTSLTRRW
eukprot:TRINITY_DN11721_c0_g2_i1.p1 TRINITY_DN11721_c0_g2~~TRINITY_DN11721_c0_g2_i1.p1  ORF type:complete len:303 (+),score=21.60 TRINITY_DN11721_c0_g2_i1:58-909(+)